MKIMFFTWFTCSCHISLKTNQEKSTTVFLPSNCRETIIDLSARFEIRMASLRNRFLTNPVPDGAGRCDYKSLPLTRRRRWRRYVEKQLGGSQQWRTNTPVLLWAVKRKEKNLKPSFSPKGPENQRAMDGFPFPKSLKSSDSFR